VGKSPKSDHPDVASLKVISPDKVPVDRRVSVDYVEAVAERLRTLAPGHALEIPMPSRKRAENLQARLRYAGFKSVVRGGKQNEEACLYAYAPEVDVQN
jgi:hypothetical protein